MKFTGYDNAEQAENVWQAYENDISRLGLETQATDLVDRCISAEQLDFGLDILVTKSGNKARTIAGVLWNRV